MPSVSSLDAAEAPVALLIVDDGGIERPLVEVGPERVAEIELRIGALPQQEVAQA